MHTHTRTRLPPAPGPLRAPRRLPEAQRGPRFPPGEPCTHLPETSCLCSRRRRRHRPSSRCRASLPHSIAQRGGGAWPFPRPARSAAHPHCGRLPDPQRRQQRHRRGPALSRSRRPGPRCLPAPAQRQQRQPAAAARPPRSARPLAARRSPPRGRRPGLALQPPPEPAGGDGPGRGSAGAASEPRGRPREGCARCRPSLSPMNGASAALPCRAPPPRLPRAGLGPPDAKMAAAALRPATAGARPLPPRSGLEVRRRPGPRTMNELGGGAGRGPAALPLAGGRRGPSKARESSRYVRPERGVCNRTTRIPQKTRRCQGDCTEIASHGLRCV